MKRHSKAILIVLVLLGVLVGAALFAAKRYVESDGTRERLAAALAQSIGVPVTLANVQFALPNEIRFHHNRGSIRY